MTRPQALCACGTTTPVYDGVLGLHEPKAPDGQQHPVTGDAYGSSGCRYSLRTVTLDAAIQRDNILGPVEQQVRDATRDMLDRGMVFTAPKGYRLPKVIANLLALADANGWGAVQMWMPADDGYVLSLRVGRADNWQYDLCWLVAPDVAQEIELGRGFTPDSSPYSIETPSIGTIRKVIAQNPLSSGDERPYLGSPRFASREKGAHTTTANPFPGGIADRKGRPRK